ncbi:MAG TPA: hypothetical protein VMW12_14225 [Candidatus Dormibacteraeota bacterium]|nr:hypothetical protein [Candidatus Dormibacteraeota bacterium]
MNAAHLHLISNHAPLFGLIAGLLLLAWGMLRNSHEIRIVSYVLFILSALAAGLAYLSGDAAESLVENMAGISEAAIERHQDIATVALALIGLTAVVSIVAMFAERGGAAFRRGLLISLFVVGAISVGVVSYTASLGGQIHHTEITTPK